MEQSQPSTDPVDFKDKPAAIESVNASPDLQRAKQKRFQLYLWGLFRVIVTVLLLGGTAGLLKGFSNKQALDKTQKYTFNTIIILLTTLLGINMSIAHSQVVHFIREGITHRNPSVSEKSPNFRDLKKSHNIGLRTVCIFLWHIVTRRQSTLSYPGGIGGFSVLILVWLLLNLSVTVAISLIGYTNSLEDDVTGFHPNGEIFIANLDHFYPNRSDTTEPTANEESFMARLYSDISISYEDTTSHNLGSEKEKEYHVVDLGDDKGWRYYFRQSDTTGKVVTRSDRYIDTSATCKAFKILNYAINTDVLEGPFSTPKVQYVLEDFSLTNQLPLPYTGTTYYSAVKQSNWIDFDIVNCGPRCGLINVTQIPDIDHLEDNAWFYSCQSTVGEVQGADHQEQKVPNKQALFAATSLSQGTEGVAVEGVGVAYNAYTAKVRFQDLANGSTTKMAKTLSRGSAGCIAALDEMNPRKTISGEEPWLGVGLRVNWGRLIAVLVAIFGVQLIITVSAILWHHMNCEAVETQPLAASTAADGTVLSTDQAKGTRGGFRP